MSSANHSRQNEPPNMGDFIANGLPLIDALTFEREIENNPEIESAEWWKRFRSLTCPSGQGGR
jgi:hypothetical protein